MKELRKGAIGVRMGYAETAATILMAASSSTWSALATACVPGALVRA